MPVPSYQELMLPVLTVLSEHGPMIEHNIGVTTTRSLALKRIDSDYFEET